MWINLIAVLFLLIIGGVVGFYVGRITLSDKVITPLLYEKNRLFKENHECELAIFEYEQILHPLEEIVKDVVASALDVSYDDLEIGTKFGDLPQWDSMGHMEVLLALEKRFDLSEVEKHSQEFTSIAKICRYILKYKGFGDWSWVHE